MDRFDRLFSFRYFLYGISQTGRVAIDIACLILVTFASFYIFYRPKTPRSQTVIKSTLLAVNTLSVAWMVLFSFRAEGYLEWATICLTPLFLFSILALIALKFPAQSFIARSLEFIVALIALEFYAFYFIFGEVIVIHGLVNFA